jgi:hypothetical protein
MTLTVPGAYGFRLSGVETGAWLGVRGAAEWPEITCRTESRLDAPELVLDGARFELRVRADIPHSELVHPLLGRLASHLLVTRGGDGMHAGAVAGASGAWAVIGPKGAGKSTLLAGLAKVGIPIVSDDVLVFADGLALAGPRCIDLRPDMTRFGLGIAVRPSDPRHRISLPPIAAEHRLIGLIHLEWSAADTTIQPLNHREAIERLLAVRSEKGWPRDPRALLDLATLPTLCLRRPRTMHGLDRSIALVQRLLLDPGAIALDPAPAISAVA